jgi:hypothetical protein
MICEYDDPGLPGMIWERELFSLFFLARQMSSIVEIGSWKGKSTHALLSGCRGIVFSVDNFKGSPLELEEGGKEKEALTNNIKECFLKNIDGFWNFKLLEMESMEAARLFPNEFVDMVFIDGDHRFESVKQDIDAWYPKCKKLLCGHDYDRNHEGVMKAVEGCGHEFFTFAETMWGIKKGDIETFESLTVIPMR